MRAQMPRRYVEAASPRSGQIGPNGNARRPHPVRQNERLLCLAAVLIFPQPLQPPDTSSCDMHPRSSSGLRLSVFMLTPENFVVWCTSRTLSMAQLCKNGQPAYKKIQGTILKRLESGQLKPGDMVASERELAKIHRVSLMTARHALSELEREGMVVRRRGAGTFVAPPKIHFNRLMSYTELMAGRSLTARSKLLSLQTVEDEQEIAARLALPNGGRLLRLERLRQGGEEPFALEICYMSAEIFEGLSRTAVERGSLFTLLEQEFGVELAYADEEIDATAADARM